MSFSDIDLYLYTILISYFLGSVPFGLLLGKAAGIGDIRKVGSGNIGATNMMRAGGKRLAAATLVLDLLKGAVAVFIVGHLWGDSFAALSVLFAVVGHVFPVWLGFKGGKGVATLLGSFLVLKPVLGLSFILIWVAVFVACRISAMSALLAVTIAPSFIYVVYGFDGVLFIAVAVLLVVYRHKDNISRIVSGRELGFGGGKGDGRRG